MVGAVDPSLSEVYPHDAQGKPIDTPDWRDATNIQKEASTGDSLLIKAVRKYEKEPELLEAALAEQGCDVNSVDKYGMAALHLALKAKLPKVTRAVTPAAPPRAPRRAPPRPVRQAAMALLDTGNCDINLQSRRGFTPLMVAAWKGELECCEKLVTLGAKLYVKDTGGRNAWGVAHDWHREDVLELFKKHDFHFHSVEIDKKVYEKKKSTTTAFPPAPKWRPNEQW
jgi:ankyrin repeat protein